MMGDIGPEDVPERQEGEEEELELEPLKEPEPEPGEGEQVPPDEPGGEVAAAPEPERPPKPDIGAYLKTSWDLVIQNPVLTIVGFLVVWAIIMVSVVTIVGPIVLAGPLLFGYLRVMQTRLNGEPAVFGDLFGGFKDFGKGLVTFVLAFLISLGISMPALLLTLGLGFIPCIGWVLGVLFSIAASIFIAGALFFLFPIAALSDVGAGQAVAASFRFCFRHPVQVFLLALVTSIVGTAGSVACGLGWILTMPIALAMTVVAYNRYYLPAAEAAA